MAWKHAGTQLKKNVKKAPAKMRRGTRNTRRVDLGWLIKARVLPAKLLKEIMSRKLLKVSGPKGGGAEFGFNKEGTVIIATVRTARGKTQLLFKASDGMRLPDRYLTS